MKRFLIGAVRRVFRALGFEIVRRDGTFRSTLAEMLEHVAGLGFKPETVIDVGVAHGTFALYETFPQATHLLVEPVQEWEGDLKRISQKYKAQYVIAAASDHSGEITIYAHPELIGSSIFRDAEGSQFDGIPRQVPAVTLDDLCRERRLKGPYLLKVDVQGAELKVLDGAKEVLEDTELVILEVSLFQFVVGGPQFYDVVSYMKQCGFVVYDVFGALKRPLDGALAQLDVAFVKETGLFRKQHIYATREQREQLVRQLSARNPKR